MRQRQLACALALGVVAAIAHARPAHAYPQFQLSTGADRCQACHFSPGGGGLLNDYGRDEAGDTISGKGDGRFLYGLWTPPDWLALGVDLRGAVGFKDWVGPELVNDVPTQDVPYPLGFPMQSDIYARFGKAKGFSFNLTIGLRDSARPDGHAGDFVDMLASREHYVMYQSDDWYVRAGRFFPIFGIHSQDHTLYIRQYLDQGFLQEPYGVAAGYFGTGWEAHVGAFGPDPSPFLGAAPDDYGVTAYYERRFHDDQAAWAAQTRIRGGPEDRQALVGAIGKWWIPGAKTMLLAEVDGGVQTFPNGGPARGQLVEYLGASWMPKTGWMFGADLQTWKSDLLLEGDSRTAQSVNVQWFFRAHWEVHLLQRIEEQALRFDHPSVTTLLQLHYYL